MIAYSAYLIVTIVFMAEKVLNLIHRVIQVNQRQLIVGLSEMMREHEGDKG